MAGVQGSALCIAVSNAGGLGSLPCAMLTADALATELCAIRQATSSPYNVNFFCHQTPTPNPEAELAWQEKLSPYYKAMEIDPGSIPKGPGRVPFNEEMAAVLDEFQPPVVSFHFGLPDMRFIERIKGWGGKVMSSATTVDEALWLESHGADAIIAQGLEAGGHRGMFLTDDLNEQVGTFALVQQITRHVKVPVIAAGGIADAQGVRAVMQLGASGVQVGTAYLLSDEATTSTVHRAALRSAAASHTAITNVFTGRPARGIVNRLMQELGPIGAHVPAFPTAGNAIAPLRAKAEAIGSSDFSAMWAGQQANQCLEQPAKVITESLIQGFLQENAL